MSQDDKLNTIEKDDLIQWIRDLQKKVKELEAEVLRIRKLLQE